MDTLQSFLDDLLTRQFAQLSITTGTSFLLIAAAEIGDKSQLVCMTLASRHRGLPVIWGAMFAFILLNTLAVVFGAAIASWLAEYIIASTVALLFAVFGLLALLNHDDEEYEEIPEKSGRGIFLTTFMLITVAEFGDKTQLAVVAYSSTANPYAVWLGATIALTFTSALGVLAGRTILQQMPMYLLHRLSGLIFLALSAFAAHNAYQSFLLAVEQGILEPLWKIPF